MPAPTILWFRRDLRLCDHAALSAAASLGPVLPVFLLDRAVARLGAASRWRLQQSLTALRASLAARGLPLIFLRGEGEAILPDLARRLGAQGVMWQRRYDAAGMGTDRALKSRLRAEGLGAQSFPGFLLAEPWALSPGSAPYSAPGAGPGYRVFTPFWRALRLRDPGPPLPVPPRLVAPPAAHLPEAEALEDWHLDRAMQRGAAVLARHHPAMGEAESAARLLDFVQSGVLADYGTARDRLDQEGQSDLSSALTWGELSPRQVWDALRCAMHQGNPGAEPFLRQLAWRDFAWHLFHHARDMDRREWSPAWEGFAWRNGAEALQAWQRGQTGEPLVDAAMRQLYVTGRMHNRARMVAASYLTKHLLTDWRAGLAWFADCLSDWDAASNVMGWQWVAGCGPDAAPFFRIFNPRAQAAKFDPEGRYQRRWGPDNADFHAAAPRSWGLEPGAAPPLPILDLAEGRQRALAAHAAHQSAYRAAQQAQSRSAGRRTGPAHAPGDRTPQSNTGAAGAGGDATGEGHR